ncbi:MAG TPA: hypothetical protein VHI54_08755 [Actinomycetota bacterium]|nr:hypothetical protein [Actinomycetota bacterium]
MPRKARRRPWVISGVVAIGLLTGFQHAVAQPEGLHCPSGGQKFSSSGSVGGVNFQASGNTLTMTNTTSGTVTVTWCAKGGSKFWNGGYTSGVRSTSIPAGQSRSASFNQGVSYFVVYGADGEGGNPPPPPPPPNGNGGNPPDNGGGGGGGPGSPLAPPAEALEGEPAVTG